MSLLSFTENGIYCAQADVYIDPWRPVKKALITHGHSDHARWGHQYYLCTESAMPVIRYRLGNVNITTIAFGQEKYINGVSFQFLPAGHILGSAQIRVEYKGEIWVVSGDYKLEDDGLAEAFEPVPCHSFITESTFGLPVYKWRPQAAVFEDINQWWADNKANGKYTILTAYALGKAQRILRHLDPSIGPILTHGAIENTNEIIRQQGIELPDTVPVASAFDPKIHKGGIVIAPPSAIGSSWIKKFKSASLGVASGWMNLRGARRRRAVDRGFVLSDHADWDGLNQTIQATGAEHIYVTHGYTDIFRRWLIEQGYDAHEVKTEYTGELAEMNEETSNEDTVDKKEES
ncbi:MAG: ligase-associated DNA damage response exonuclease [Saprospiraceae bacterium]|nr:ligase-associated DNA damage response exonuclease [Saprospiraceae bacterium]